MIPQIHADLSAKRYGGKPIDYLDIHILLDSTKGSFPDNRHRAITHNSWFTTNILPLIFGQTRINSDGKTYNVKDVGEHHILEDFRMKFIPSVQDYLENMSLEPWMNNGLGVPNSAKMLYNKEVMIEETVKPEPIPTIIDLKYITPNPNDYTVMD